jgi:hypothetical protein
VIVMDNSDEESNEGDGEETDEDDDAELGMWSNTGW